MGFKIGTVDVKDLKISGLRASLGVGLAGIVAGLVALGSFWYIDLPGSKLSRELAERTINMEVLDHVLRGTSASDRRESLGLAMLPGVLRCDEPADSTRLFSLIADSNRAPPARHDIEADFTTLVLKEGLHEERYAPDTE